MAIKIFNNHISGSTIGISAPKNANIDIGANAIINCGTAIEIRDEVSLRAVLGLSKEAKAEDISMIFQAINNSPTLDTAIETARSSGAESLLSAGANITTLISGFFQLKESGLVQAALAVLSGQA